MNKTQIKEMIDEMIYALQYAKDLNEVFEIEEGIIELENLLKKSKKETKESILNGTY